MHEKEYIIFCDESDKKGKFYSNFYGGTIVGASHYQRITNILNSKKADLNLLGEIKWEKVTARYLEKYQAIIKCFFEEVRLGNLRIRIMFTQNAWVPQSLTKDDLDLQYYKLYYQFIKHGFGLKYAPIGSQTKLRIYLDELPDSGEKAESFKGYLLGMASSTDFKRAKLNINKSDITELRSHDHVILQCLDIVLGSMSFRLNDKHKEKPLGSKRRGKRTIAKAKLYRTILEEIRSIHPNFNIGISTGFKPDYNKLWHSPYMHWKFTSSDSNYDNSKTKNRKTQ